MFLDFRLKTVEPPCIGNSIATAIHPSLFLREGAEGSFRALPPQLERRPRLRRTHTTQNGFNERARRVRTEVA